MTEQIFLKGRSFCLFSLLITAVFFLAACAYLAPPQQEISPTSTPNPTAIPSGRSAGGTLHLLYWQAPTTLNPHLATGVKDREAARITLEPLATYDKDGKLLPVLAAEIPSLENGGLDPNGKWVTWKLKSSVKWSDGEPFTAKDVRFTYDFIVNPETGATTKTNYEAVKSVEVIDDLTVKINFKETNPVWAVPFVGIPGLILPQHQFESFNGPKAKDAPANLNPVGTGPYQVVSFKPQEVLFLGSDLVKTYKIVFEPNPFFRDRDKPYYSRVELRGGGTVNEAARLVLQTGEVDYAWNLQLDASTLDKLEQTGRGKVISILGPGVERLVLNFSDHDTETPDGERSSIQFANPFLSDKKVRQALTYAIDREAIAKLFLEGKTTSNLLVAPPIYNSPNTSYEFNPEKAKALLDEAGWKDTTGDGIRDKDGKKLSLLYQTSANPARQQGYELMRQSLAEIGIELKPEFIDAGIFFSANPSSTQTLEHFYADLEQYYAYNFNPDPGAYMQYWTSNQIPQKANSWKGQNMARWQNSEYDDLYRQSTVELDPQKRQQLFIKMNDMIINDVVVIPLVNRAQVSGVGLHVEGVDLTPWDAEVWNIQDWRSKP